jgi:hypothetical protein
MRVPLSGSLDTGHYLVIGTGGTIALPAAIQNGSTTVPTAVAIIDTVKLTVVDSVSFAGSTTTGGLVSQIMGFPAPTQFAEGTFKVLLDTTTNSTQGSLVRVPNGQDTDNQSADWTFKSPPSPGATN